MFTTWSMKCFAYVLATAPVILSLKLQVDGKMDFGRKWNYEYRIKALETEARKPDRKSFAIDSSKFDNVRQSDSQPKIIDIIIKNNKSNPHLVQVAEARIFEGKNKENTRGRGRETEDIQKIIKEDTNEQYTPVDFSDEYPAPNKSNIEDQLTKTGKYVHHIVRIGGEVDAPTPIILEEFKETRPVFSMETYNNSTVLMPAQKRKHKRHRFIQKYTNREADIKLDQGNSTLTSKMEVVESYSLKPAVKQTDHDFYVEPRLVKDDPLIKEFTMHLYEESIKALQSIKDKVNNYEMKKETDKLMRSYEDKFGEFVRETQNQKIRTRLGSQKVILNTLDTSNRILDRLVNYMIGNMEIKGILRDSDAENVILNELNKKKDLENKHICVKMQICTTNESYTKFAVDVLDIVSSSDDNHIIEIRNAVTEVLKNTNFSHILDNSTEQRFLKGISDLEKYSPATIRAIFFMMKNLLSSRNRPIKVVGKADDRVNKTLALLEILDNRDKALPPNEQNVLEWNDMENSLNDWKVGKRKDTLDIVHHFKDHFISVLSGDDVNLVNRNVNLILGI